MYYNVEVHANMQRKQKPTIKKHLLTKASIVTIIVITAFVFAYVFVIAYTYGNLFTTGSNNLLSSTEGSAATFSKVVSGNISQMNYLASEFTEHYDSNEDDNSEIEHLKEFISGTYSSSCEALTFIKTDGTYCSTTGKSGSVDIEKFLKKIDSSEIFVANDGDEASSDYAYFYKEITVNGEVKGYLLGKYNLAASLNETYSDEMYIDESVNMLITDKGEIIISTSVNQVFDKVPSNFFDFIDKNKYESVSSLVDNSRSSNRAKVTTLIINDNKYVAAFAPLNDHPQYYVARILPSSAIFEQTGHLLAFMTVASLCFFFGIVLVGYKYYKSTTETTKRVQSVALTDPLTGYANFAKFKADASDILREDPNGEYFIACADMVGFRYINDAFGYDTGDQILINITKQIDDLLLDDEIFARISGDKFIILTKRDFSDTDHNMFIYQLTDRISTIQPLAKSHIRLEVQMGIYKVEKGDIEHMSVNAMYDRSLVALYAIEHVDTGVAVYDAAIHNEQIAKKDIESKMHQALKDGEFRVYVQPKYRTSNGKLAAGEALIRWVDPDEGIVPPIKFIPLFEQNRFVHDIDLYVMEVVARFLRMRLNEGLPVVPISLNISPVEITMPDFRESYISIKEKYDIPDKLIELEFTEGIFFENEELFRDVIVDFQNHGFTCSMDDFGSGYSSLNILKDLPVDTLKLDKLFFRESENTARDRAIIRSVIAMARSLNIKTVAEGVETLDVVDFLKLVGCTLIQGYIYSKPLPLTEFEERLDNENIDTDDGIEFDFDKFEVVPLDMPLSNSLDNSLRRTYAAIIEINAGGNIYHIYYPGESNVRFEKIPERGFYSSFMDDLVPKFVHPADKEKIKQIMNPLSLANHFKTNNELDFEYRHMRKDGSYSWMKLHVIKASGGRADSQIFFGYFNIIDDYKETEESLSALKGRFSAAYSKFNGAVFELDLKTGKTDLLETHSNLLAAVKDVKDYDILRVFVRDNLLHPDYKEKLASICSLEHLREYFIKEKHTDDLVVEVYAHPSRKLTSYNYYIAKYIVQDNNEKILLTVEDATKKKADEAKLRMQHRVTDTAFANYYERVTRISLDKDLYTATVYPSNNIKNSKTSEGKYSVHWESIRDNLIKEDDKDTLDQLLSLDGLRSFFKDNDTNQFKISFEERRNPESSTYEWKEILVIAAPVEFLDDEVVYLFKYSINEERETERMLNEYAHRLSYSLAMFDYAYSVDCDTEKVEIIGGLRFDTSIFEQDSLSYSQVTLMVKNDIIDEEDRPVFRRFTYLDELTEYFQTHAATITKYFRQSGNDKNFVEVSVIYGAREKKITIFIRTIEKALLSSAHFWDKKYVPNYTDVVSDETAIESSIGEIQADEYADGSSD